MSMPPACSHFASMGSLLTVKSVNSAETVLRIKVIHRSAGSNDGGCDPAAYGAHLVARRRGREQGCFKYKKEKPVNSLKSFDRKRHIVAINRHDRSVNRQNVLALLSFNCHTSVCLVTNLEVENDG